MNIETKLEQTLGCKQIWLTGKPARNEGLQLQKPSTQIMGFPQFSSKPCWITQAHLTMIYDFGATWYFYQSKMLLKWKTLTQHILAQGLAWYSQDDLIRIFDENHLWDISVAFALCRNSHHWPLSSQDQGPVQLDAQSTRRNLRPSDVEIALLQHVRSC